MKKCLGILLSMSLAFSPMAEAAPPFHFGPPAPLPPMTSTIPNFSGMSPTFMSGSLQNVSVVNTSVTQAAAGDTFMGRMHKKLCGSMQPWHCAMAVLAAASLVYNLIAMRQAKKAKRELQCSGRDCSPNFNFDNDSDGDGVLDGLEDDDGDGVANNDDDSDGDGIPDGNDDFNNNSDNNGGNNNNTNNTAGNEPDPEDVLTNLGLDPGALEREANQTLAEMDKKGFRLNRDGALETPNGKINPQALGTAAGMRASGFSDEAIKDLADAAAEVQKQLQPINEKIAAAFNESGGGGAISDTRNAKNGADEKFDPYAFLRKRGGTNNRGPASAGLAVNHGNDKVHNKNTNLFEAIHIRYKEEQGEGRFFNTPSPVTTPSRPGIQLPNGG